ncbi:MAG: hypothetical protein H0V44_13310 [Planctomycetes bacterium]|nr:hypothetical protein [Planctomycetota bacterium]
MSEPDSAPPSTPAAPPEAGDARAPGAGGQDAGGGRSITFKSVFFGLAGVGFIALYANFNSEILKLSSIIGNQLPIGPFFIILVLATLWNPLAGKVSSRLRLSTREFAVVLAMMLISCWLPMSGFYMLFQRAIITPWTVAAGKPDWEVHKTLSHLPKELFPLEHERGSTQADKEAYERVYESFAQGIPHGDEKLGLTEAPYREWLPAMMRWAPLLLFVSIAVISLILLVHRQWSHHEQLAYPLAIVSTALIARTGSRATSDIFYSRLFWFGFAPVFAIHLFNYLHAWFPLYVPEIKLTTELIGEFKEIFPSLKNSMTHVTSIKVSFLIIGIAYFIASDISLSLGMASLFVSVFTAQFYIMSGGMPVGWGEMANIRAGSYVAYAALLVYTGRHFYWKVFNKAVRPISQREDMEAVWAARIFVLSFACFVGFLITVMDLDWFIALIYAGSVMLFMLVFTRIICETGLPFLAAGVDIINVITSLLGAPAVGPGALVVIYYLSCIIKTDTTEALMPYVATSLKTADNVGVSRPRLLTVAFAGMTIAFALCFFSWTYGLYAKGSGNNMWVVSPSIWALDNATTKLAILKDTEQLAESANTHGLAKLGLIPQNVGNGLIIKWMGLGAFFVLAFSLLRFRFAWWPLHPVAFLVWGTSASRVTWFSFFLGWCIKELIVRFGGGRSYQSLKPIFLGLIMGEIVAVAMTLVCGAFYYWSTGLLPKTIGIW